MSLPGFTAEDSLANSGAVYRQTPRGDDRFGENRLSTQFGVQGAVNGQRCRWQCMDWPFNYCWLECFWQVTPYF